MSDRRIAPRTDLSRRLRRMAAEMGAALLGVAAGVYFAEPVLAGAGRTWTGFILPAYDELVKSGVFAWCL